MRSGSNEYYRLKKEVDYILVLMVDATTHDEIEKWAEKGEALARNMREEYGLGDEHVKRIIEDN